MQILTLRWRHSATGVLGISIQCLQVKWMSSQGWLNRADWNKKPIGIFMKANADRYLKGMPMAFVFFIWQPLFWLFWSDRYKVFSSREVHCGTSKRVAMLYLSFDRVRQSPFADSIKPLCSRQLPQYDERKFKHMVCFILLRQLQLLMLRGIPLS